MKILVHVVFKIPNSEWREKFRMETIQELGRYVLHEEELGTRNIYSWAYMLMDEQ